MLREQTILRVSSPAEGAQSRYDDSLHCKVNCWLQAKKCVGRAAQRHPTYYVYVTPNRPFNYRLTICE